MCEKISQNFNAFSFLTHNYVQNRGSSRQVMFYREGWIPDLCSNSKSHTFCFSAEGNAVWHESHFEASRVEYHKLIERSRSKRGKDRELLGFSSDSISICVVSKMSLFLSGVQGQRGGKYRLASNMGTYSQCTYIRSA